MEPVPLQGCCEPFHDGEKLPPTPEALMRSRFSAFVKEDSDFLVRNCLAPGHKVVCSVPGCTVAQVSSEALQRHLQ